MDTMVQKSLDAVERKKKRHFPEFLNMSETQRRDRIHEMHLDYDRAIKTANEKVQQSGDLVKKMDRAIKYLDRQLAEYQRYLEQTPGLIRKLQQRSMNLDVAYEEEQDDYDEQYTQFATPTAKNNKR
ncbi:uncharacterized protein MONBRDRAFT_25384 [Monosiga brevicollis MX1]|uniref:Inhibitor of growth protein N-terminal histone-binding domain-containing protein n=1 Tax=Monosiga brevicollis TaxID=81824 RepID=A9UZ93_MONBE|nr:uncharacterized protein MONBRDRAFT_25384 [Monosiga brevicollis MX1]EDQ89327.1 predicted protein [Monosiga brevicollis MX1]|eukprot:XP_001745903.1 hypothetical protein [Monosiga brevicollis MX1]